MGNTLKGIVSRGGTRDGCWSRADLQGTVGAKDPASLVWFMNSD